MVGKHTPMNGKLLPADGKRTPMNGKPPPANGTRVSIIGTLVPDGFRQAAMRTSLHIAAFDLNSTK
jgi:hypothetical protein